MLRDSTPFVLALVAVALTLVGLIFRFAGAIEEPLGQFPLTKAVILLQNLPAKDFLRGQVIDLLSSPYLQLQNASSTGTSPAAAAC